MYVEPNHEQEYHEIYFKLVKELFNACPDKDWCWYWISWNPNLTMKDILDNPDKDWDWYYLSSNPSAINWW